MRAALAEDLGPGDATTLACIPLKSKSLARMIAREYLVVAVAAHFNQVKLQHLHPPQQENEKQSLSSSTTLSRVVFSLAGKLRCMDMPHTIASLVHKKWTFLNVRV